MAKFNTQGGRVHVTAPVTTTGVETTTFEGGLGFERTPKGELFTLALVNMVGENTFYESAKDRDARFNALVHKVTQDDPEWIRGFLPWLRGPEVNMRSAPVVAVAEYIAAGGPNGRSLVNAVLQRPDELGEILAYWMTNHGRRLPAALKRGVADAAVRMLREGSALKYDGGDSKAFRLGDVIELTHPKPRDAEQAALFAYLLDRRHHASEIRADLGKLPKISLARELDRLDRDAFRARFLADPDALAAAGYTWERLGGKTEMDAKAWEAIIPSMGYMALLRNLRNFDEAKISKEVRDAVARKLSDPVEVATSRQLPFRFLSAHKAAPALFWGGVLEDALDWSTGNVPELRGRTLILVDISGSMMATLSSKSSVARYEAGALFGSALWKKNDASATLVAFGTHSEEVKPRAGASVLSVISEFSPDSPRGHRVGWGTNGYQALARHYDGHDRVVFFTDEQMHPDYGTSGVADKVPVIYTFNLGGYRAAMQASTKGRFTLGGFSDATFKMMALLERGKDAGWPWEAR